MDYDLALANGEVKGVNRERELRARRAERRAANRGYAGWHFGLSDKPFYAKDKEGFRKELEKRGLVMRDEVVRRLK